MDAVIGQTARFDHVVGDADSAHTLGNPGIHVLATPRLADFCDRAAAAAAGEISTAPMRVDIRHLAATPVGGTIEIVAELVAIEGRRLVFRVTGRDSAREIVSGRVDRVTP